MQPGVRLGFGAAFLALMASTTGHAHQDSEAVDLTWNAPKECPPRGEVLAEVARILSESHEGRVPTTVRVDVAIAENGRWRAALSIDARGARGERRFEAESCAAVASAAALIVAVSVEGGVLPPPAPPMQSTSPTRVPQRRDESWPAREAETARVADRARAWGLLATVAGLVDDGTMPDAPAGGVEGALGWTLPTPRWRLRALAGLATYPTQSTNGGTVGEIGRFSLLTASARVCASMTRGRFELGPCLGGEIASMSASGVGPAGAFQPGSAHGVWGAALGAAVASWSLSRFVAIFARGEGVLRLARTRFVLTPGDIVVHEPSPVAGRLAVGLELRFF